MERHIMTLCLLLLALDPALKLKRQVTNWLERQRIHKEHIRRMGRPRL